MGSHSSGWSNPGAIWQTRFCKPQLGRRRGQCKRGPSHVRWQTSLKGHAGIEGTEHLVGWSDPKCRESGMFRRTGDEIKSSVVLSRARHFGALTAALVHVNGKSEAGMGSPLWPDTSSGCNGCYQQFRVFYRLSTFIGLEQRVELEQVPGENGANGAEWPFGVINPQNYHSPWSALIHVLFPGQVRIPLGQPRW